MTLRIDTSRALRTHDQLVALIRAVVAADKGDESRSIEWKSGYSDLLSTDASFAIARAILGLANRPVDVAASAFEGVGYVVIGAEPGSISGQSAPDSAEVLNALRRYTGPGSPFWDQRTIDVDGTEVLVVTVEPPRAGDRIALLHKGFQGNRGGLIAEGTIFVRQPGATERASRQEIEMLQERLIAGASAAERERVSTRNSQVRDAVVACVAAAHRWADMFLNIVIMTGQDGWSSRRDFFALMDTDAGRSLGEDVRIITDSARLIRLLVTDDSLLAAVEHAVDCMKDQDGFDGIHRDPVTDEARGLAYRHIGQVKRAWDAVEVAAISVVADK